MRVSEVCREFASLRVTSLVKAGVVTAMLATIPVLAGATTTPAPDFGPNVKIFEAGTSVDQINQYLQSISSQTITSSNRYAVFFKPGTYGSAAGAATPATATGIVNSQVGYYTTIAGLGTTPDSVLINGALHSEPQPSPNGPPDSLVNFWRSLTNLSINPIQRPIGADASLAQPQGIESAHTMRWAVSQASPLRRVHITGNLDLNGEYGANGFGSVISDSRIDGTVSSGFAATGMGQAQYFTHDSAIGGWNGDGVNLTFAGVIGAPPTNFGTGGTTALQATPVSRPAPFLFFANGAYSVFAPSARQNSSGVNWAMGTSTGRTLPISSFYIAKPTDTATTINQALASGLNLILTPGVYTLTAPVHVTHADTVVMGLGYATLAPASGVMGLQIDDVQGVVVSGVVVDTPAAENVLIQVGTPGGVAGLAADPISLLDVFARINAPTNSTTSVVVNSNHVLLEGMWIDRNASNPYGDWTSIVASHGLIINGSDVEAQGMSVEHFQQQQLTWNGERGTTLMFQSEAPYDVPSQSVWMNGTKEGYASYVVSPSVKTHTATGLAVYALFIAGFAPGSPQIHLSSGIESPALPVVQLHSMSTGVIQSTGGIRHVVNSVGAAVDSTLPNSTIAGMELSLIHI